MTYSDICATARLKAARAATVEECEAAIADCHDTLRVGQYEFSSPYAVKLWAEIDAYRARKWELEQITPIRPNPWAWVKLHNRLLDESKLDGIALA